jgi:hypothetical protein
MNQKLRAILDKSKKELNDWGITVDVPKRFPFFECPICGNRYETVKEMMECFETPNEHGRFEVGDIVIIGGKWSSGPSESCDPWTAFILPADPKNTNHFRHHHQHWGWFVITSLWNEKHREVSSVFSFNNDRNSFGWNPTIETTHCPMWKPGEFIENDYYREELASVVIAPPSDELKRQAAMLVRRGFITQSLL